MPVKTPQRWTAADHVYEILEELVISGQLKPGDRLTEVSLAEQLEVSRTPLRQALQRLVSKGWIQRAPNGAIRVVDVSDGEIEALYAVRNALEDLILCQAFQRMQTPDVAALRALIAAQEHAAKAGNAHQVSHHGEAFHRLLWSLSGNAVGAQFLEDVLQRTTRYRRLSFVEPYRFREGMKQHSRLLAALEKGELESARKILRAHVDESRRYVLQAFKAWKKGSRS
jgi:DNA-binding GntR family transcriptional regulator